MKVPIDKVNKKPKREVYYNDELKKIMPHLYPVDKNTTYY